MHEYTYISGNLNQDGFHIYVYNLTELSVNETA